MNTHSIYIFYCGRVVSGVAVGAATVLIPMYSAEMAPKEIRGQLGSCFQLLFAVGVATSYWVDWVVGWSVDGKSSRQWQIPIGLQLIPGAVLGIGMLYVKESARWLATKGRHDDALQSLLWVRGGVQDRAFDDEFLEILTTIKEEMREKEGFGWRELWSPSTRYRLFIAIGVQFCAQMTGNTSLAYYAPQIFSAVGAEASSLLMTGFFGFAKILGVLVFQFVLVDRIGRRKPFIFGAALMGTLMLCIAAAASNHPPGGTNGPHASSGAMAIVLIWVEAAVFNG
jgi:MFS family permease